MRIDGQCEKHLLIQCKVCDENMSFLQATKQYLSVEILHFLTCFFYNISMQSFFPWINSYPFRSIYLHHQKRIIMSTCLTYPLINTSKPCFQPFVFLHIRHVHPSLLYLPHNAPLFTVLLLQLWGLVVGAKLYDQGGKTNWSVSYLSSLLKQTSSHTRQKP